jgi:isoquinoline 1-oxidoreductase alpha subunit
MVTVTVNGERRDSAADLSMPLLWFLRDELGLTGTKYGCGIGECGVCTVHVDGLARRSCVMSLAQVADRTVTTIEGLGGGDALSVIQEAWLQEDVAQCGYCQSGQIMAAAALLAATPRPSDADIDDAMRGVLCRCGTYSRIRSAIKRAAKP